MARRKRKKPFAIFVLWIAILSAVISFFLPWVAFPSAVALPNVKAESILPKSTLIEGSWHGIRRYSLNGRKMGHYAGYQLPPLLWKTESGQPGKLIFMLAGHKNLRYRGLMLYLYPVLPVFVILVMRRRKYRFAGRIIGIAGSCAVCWIQFIEVGFTRTGLTPMSVYLDYGFWLGAMSFLLFGFTVFFVKTI
jgi:hypothetical protein